MTLADVDLELIAAANDGELTAPAEPYPHFERHGEQVDAVTARHLALLVAYNYLESGTGYSIVPSAKGKAELP